MKIELIIVNKTGVNCITAMNNNHFVISIHLCSNEVGKSFIGFYPTLVELYMFEKEKFHKDFQVIIIFIKATIQTTFSDKHIFL